MPSRLGLEEKTLKEYLKTNFIPNELEYYDNVTYNIRFYMLPFEIQKKLSEARAYGDKFEIKDEYKVIIAETGVSSKISIDSLQMKTVYSSLSQNNSCLTYQMDMKLKEVNGCMLQNKLIAVSKLLGYEGFVHQPYHIDVWFTGYDHATHMPIKVIGEMLTFEVIVSEVKTNVDMTGTVYNFVMVNAGAATLEKDNFDVVDLGSIVFGTKTPSLIEFKNKIQEYMNQHYFEKYKDDELLNRLGKIKYTINLVDGDQKSISNIVIDKFNKGLLNQYIIEPISKFDNLNQCQRGSNATQETSTNDFKQSIIPNSNKTSNNDFGQSIRPNSNKTSQTKIELPKKLLGGTIDFNSITVDNNIAPIYTDNPVAGEIRAEAKDSISSLFQKICFSTEALRDYIVRPEVQIKDVGVYNGEILKQVTINMVFHKNSYMKHYIETYRSRDVSKSAVLTSKEKEELYSEMQLEMLEEFALNQTLQKKYEWLFNGHDTSVLEMNSDIDRLWYSNIPVLNREYAYSGSVKPNNKEEQGTQISREQIVQALRNKIYAGMKQYDPLRGLAHDKRLYVEDIYNTIPDNIKQDFLDKREVLFRSDGLSDSSTPSQSDTSTDAKIYAETAYSNVFKSGNLIDMKIKILGDPYWIAPCDDRVLYRNDFVTTDFLHFVFKMHGALDMKPDGTYDLENMAEFSNIFQLVESTSLFSDGVFTQQLTGTLNPAFVNISRIGL